MSGTPDATPVPCEQPQIGRDPATVLSTLAQKRPSLELGTLDLCFLTLLHLEGERCGTTHFDEPQLLDGYDRACAVVEPEADNRRARATHALRRLREQRLLTRVDGAGITRAGQFALTRLASAIVEFYATDETLTRESLTLLTRTLMSSLVEITRRARNAEGSDAWRSGVIAPLEVTIQELISGIERRQRGMDLQQEQFQREISQLLSADWFGALEQCQDLLETTSTTLRELNEVLLRDTHQLHAQLEELHSLALDLESPDAQLAVAHVVEQVDRIASWGGARQQAWSEYYQYVHRYLRDVVRFDPSRALTQRLRQQLCGEHGVAFSLTVAHAPALRVLREVKPVDAPPPVRRKKKLETDEPAVTAPTADPNTVLEQHIRALLDEGVSQLSDLTARLTEDLPQPERFLQAGRIAAILAKLRRPLQSRERPWVRVDDGLAIEQWQLAGEKQG